MIFDKCDPGVLNEYFNMFPEVPGLSVKVFRTYNASVTLDQELAKYDDAVAAGKNFCFDFHKFWVILNTRISIQKK